MIFLNKITADVNIRQNQNLNDIEIFNKEINKMRKALTAVIAALTIISISGCGCGPDAAIQSSSQESSSQSSEESSSSSASSVSSSQETEDPSVSPTPEATVTTTPEAETTPEATPDPNPTVDPSETASNDIVYLLFNCDSISDWRVRAAFTISINRDAYPSPAYGIVADGITDSSGYNFEDGAPSPGNIFSILKMMYPDYDFSDHTTCCNVAQELFNEAVSEGSFDTSASVDFVMDSDISGFDAEAVASTWETLFGTDVDVSYANGGDYDSALSGGAYSVIAYEYPVGENDPMPYFELFTSGGIIPSFSNGLYDGFISDAAGTSDGVERDSYLLTAEQVLFDAGAFPCAPVCNV